MVTKKTLIAHTLSIHENEKDFKCDSCNNAFVSKGRLKNHINFVHNKQII